MAQSNPRYKITTGRSVARGVVQLHCLVRMRALDISAARLAAEPARSAAQSTKPPPLSPIRSQNRAAAHESVARVRSIELRATDTAEDATRARTCARARGSRRPEPPRWRDAHGAGRRAGRRRGRRRPGNRDISWGGGGRQGVSRDRADGFARFRLSRCRGRPECRVANRLGGRARRPTSPRAQNPRYTQPPREPPRWWTSRRAATGPSRAAPLSCARPAVEFPFVEVRHARPRRQFRALRHRVYGVAARNRLGGGTCTA